MPVSSQAALIGSLKTVFVCSQMRMIFPPPCTVPSIFYSRSRSDHVFSRFSGKVCTVFNVLISGLHIRLLYWWIACLVRVQIPTRSLWYMEQDISTLFLSTGWFQEYTGIRVWLFEKFCFLYNQTYVKPE